MGVQLLRRVISLTLFTISFVYLGYVGASSGSSEVFSSQAQLDADGKYQGVVVSIGHQVPQSSALLDSIKEKITQASTLLHNATGWSYGSVTILIPTSWNVSGDGEAYETAHFEQHAAADFRVEPGYLTQVADGEGSVVPNDGGSSTGDSFSSSSYSRHVQGCGMTGDGFVLPAELFGASTGSPSRHSIAGQLLRGWAHRKYGIFEEHPIKSPLSPNSPSALSLDLDAEEFYFGSSGKTEATRCSHKIGGTVRSVLNGDVRDCQMSEDVDPDTGKWRPYCHFVPDKSVDVTTSVMSLPQLSRLALFCDDENHNFEAPTRQNRLCQRRSAKDVITSKEGQGYGAEVSLPTCTSPIAPKFTLKQPERSRKVVLVIDQSDSMNGTKLFLAKQAAANVILSLVEDTAHVAVIAFSQTASVVTNGTVSVSTITERQLALEAIAGRINETKPHTYISSALRVATNFLEQESPDRSVAGSSVILLTDGRETSSQLLSDELNYVRNKGVILDTILFTEEADTALAQSSSTGTSRTFSASTDPASLTDAFTTLVTSRQSIESKTIQLITRTHTLQAGGEVEGVFYMDESVGTQTTIMLLSTTDSDEMTFTLGHDNSGVDARYSEELDYSREFGMRTFVLAGLPEQGPWNYKLTNRGTAPVVVTVTVNSKARRLPGGMFRPLLLREYISARQTFDISELNSSFVAIYADVSEGAMPIKNANVTASVTYSRKASDVTNAEELSFVLSDNGFGADVVRGDGVYSAYFTDFRSEPGTYYVRMYAENKGTYATVPAGTDGEMMTRVFQGDAYSRYAAAGFFSVTGHEENIAEVLPPVAIMDLRVGKLVDGRNVTLSWTAPGADLDRGQAARYELKYNYSGTHHLQVGFNVNQKPKLALSMETTTFDIISSERVTVWIEIFAVDEYGNAGERSNRVSVLINKALTPTTELPTNPTTTTTPSTGQTLQVTVAKRQGGPGDNSQLILIAGVVVGCLIFLILIIVLIMVVILRQRKWRQNKSSTSREELQNPSTDEEFMQWDDSEDQSVNGKLSKLDLMVFNQGRMSVSVQDERQMVSTHGKKKNRPDDDTKSITMSLKSWRRSFKFTTKSKPQERSADIKVVANGNLPNAAAPPESGTPARTRMFKSGPKAPENTGPRHLGPTSANTGRKRGNRPASRSTSRERSRSANRSAANRSAEGQPGSQNKRGSASQSGSRSQPGNNNRSRSSSNSSRRSGSKK